MMNLAGLMKQLQEAQQRAVELQERLAQERIETTAGGGLVKVVADGTGAILELTIDGAAIGLSAEDTELLQDTLLAALVEIHERHRERGQELIKELTGGLQLPPGLGL